MRIATLAVAVALALAAPLSTGCNKPPPPPPPEPATGTITITTTPPGAAVYKDRRQRLGSTPLTLTRPGGTLLSLTLVKDGHENQQITVTVDSGEANKAHQDLSTATGTIWVDSGFVKGAEVFVDGEYQAKTPDKIKVAAGAELFVEVKQPRFHPYRERISVLPGRTVKITAIMVPMHHKKVPGGWLTLTCDPPSEVALNGKPMGETPMERIPLPAGKHQLKLHNQALKLTSTRTLEIKASEATRIHVKLSDEADR